MLGAGAAAAGTRSGVRTPRQLGSSAHAACQCEEAGIPELGAHLHARLSPPTIARHARHVGSQDVPGVVQPGDHARHLLRSRKVTGWVAAG